MPLLALGWPNAQLSFGKSSTPHLDGALVLALAAVAAKPRHLGGSRGRAASRGISALNDNVPPQLKDLAEAQPATMLEGIGVNVDSKAHCIGYTW